LKKWEQGRAKPNLQAAALVFLARKYLDTRGNSGWSLGLAGALSGANLGRPAGFVVDAIADALLGGSIKPE
jgi:hypothetical protein